MRGAHARGRTSDENYFAVNSITHAAHGTRGRCSVPVENLVSARGAERFWAATKKFLVKIAQIFRSEKRFSQGTELAGLSAC
ncbi:hypothetical protein HMPREF3227_01787 [Corynebacterium sp. CMW7794]|nr:hypothetical protein HMPREF3227_01787 [Corynebacterium sp. CMW7794]